MAGDPTHARTEDRPEVRREPPLLSALERELLGYVERLTQVCEASAAQFTSLERRSTAIIGTRQKALEDGVRSLIASQTLLVEALSGSIQASGDTESAQQSLHASKRALMSAEDLLRRSLPE
ncbi:hypothetical protein [Ochrobactrum sp. SFR4]|uniref:hypothetical protein n=1 Tax=Ochrobactrum sp. SFR4 TaxID=2717368 RepID=UPI002570A022|nr:hypothetical protein [Ochrobactrum sp. SFR4]